MKDLKSGIEHLKQAKAHMSKANGIMSNCISKLRELEEENAGLRAKLEALIQSDDSYMKLPLDADGVPIRIGDVVYGNPGIAWTVVCLRMSKLGCKVEMENMPFLRNPDDLSHKKPDPLEPEPDDSWEKLEEDAKQRVCSYFGIDPENASCEDCPYGSSQTGRLCWRNASLDMIARAKKLAGIEEAQR